MPIFYSIVNLNIKIMSKSLIVEGVMCMSASIKYNNFIVNFYYWFKLFILEAIYFDQKSTIKKPTEVIIDNEKLSVVIVIQHGKLNELLTDGII